MFQGQGILLEVEAVSGYLATWLEAFLIARKAEGAAVGTLYFYRMKLEHFSTYCEGRAIS